MARRITDTARSLSGKGDTLLQLKDVQLHFTKIWLQRFACLAEHINIAVQLGVVGVFLLTLVAKTIGLATNHVTMIKDFEGSNKFLRPVRFSLTCKLSIVCCLALMVTHVLVLLLLVNGSGTYCSENVLVFASETLQVVLWATSLIEVYDVMKNKLIKFHWLLRTWWVLSFIMSMTGGAIETHIRIMNHGKLRLRDYVNLLVVLLCTCLFGISIRGKACIVHDLSGITDPLLNDKSDNEEHLDDKRESLYGKSTLLQLITFSWLNPLFAVGYKQPLEREMIPNVDMMNSAAFLSSSFDKSLKYVSERDQSANPSIYWTIFTFIWRKAAMNGCFAVISAATSYVGPYLINDFVSFLSEKEAKSAHSGYYLALAFLGAKTVETITQRQWIFGARQLGLRLRAALISHIYKKSLVLSSKSRQSRTSGEIINYMSVDIQRITDCMWFINMIWMLPIQISLAIYILFTNLALGSLVALVATLMVLACTIPITKFHKKFQSKIMGAKDNRMKATSEALGNMKVLKLQAWDTQILEKLKALRKIEYNWLWKKTGLNAATSFIFWGSPTLISTVTFGSCIMMGIELTTGRVLAALATFRMLQDLVFNLPDLLNVMAQGKVSADRVASFLHDYEIQQDAIQFVPKDQTEVDIEVQNGKFSWDAELELPTLDEINMKVKRGMKVAICGTVGSGKSSLLSSILGEMQKITGTVKISGTKAYVPQSPWILSGSIRENILFGNEYDNSKYEKTVEACALMKDFELFPSGDLTEIGERGINMSGGQKQRIQIARAVYQDADIYILDDPFSAVDAQTGSQLFHDCLMGILREKTILFVTHQVEFLPAADLILVMNNGKITQVGTFEKLLQENVGFEILVGAHSQALSSILNVKNATKTKQALESELTTGSTTNSVHVHAPRESNHNTFPEITEKGGKLVQDEEREKGNVKKEVYWNYLTIVKGGFFIPFILLAQLSFQVLQIASNYWMAWCCPPTSGTEPQIGMNFILFVYTLLVVGGSLCVLFRAMLVGVAGLWTAQELFSNLLHSVFRAPMTFFDSTPTGRILSRASTDQSVLDLEMSRRFDRCASSIIQMLGTIAVMSQVAWEVFVVFIPVTAICIWYQRYYIPTARELARLEGIQRTPILHHFAESLSGSSTIRAFQQEDRFIASNLSLIENHSMSWFHNAAAMEWLSFRLNILSNLVFAFSLVLLVTLPEGIIDPSIAGLAVTYGINLNVLQASVIWNICNAENKMISVERIIQYSNISVEASLSIEDCKLPTNWPQVGTICFKNLEVMVENGENWSVGQRQLFCLGRALLKKSTIVILDEATASVDSTTDGVIQIIIKEEFKERTVVTIAHRVHTIVESDFVLVLSDGTVADYDTPSKLLEREDSLFSKLVREYSIRSKGFNKVANYK
ncbi:ABC transporter C family member 9-like [Humulus lupulus]|uniref:ABC transporter C family member 9-like n=1 Tax=Humulus lupulus TaxID=3486 RepID=UPI002B408272|nr:ABC transporter C family member 9-like [Humulus lupulus]